MDGWIVADEAARLTQDLVSALHPMRARRPQARFAMLSTAWSRTDPFWTAWANDNPSWLRLRATAETDGLFSPEFLEQQRIELKGDFDREYLGIPSGAQASPFGWELYERATLIQAPLVPAGPAFAPANDQSVPIVNPFRQVYSPEDVNSWPYFRPLIIAHDVGRSRDHSTAVVGGNSPAGRRLVGIKEAIELPQGLFGHARASSLAEVDRRHDNNALIVADTSNDITYGEVLQETFGQRVIGLHISRYGDGMNASSQPVRQGHLLVYTIGRTYLLELLRTELQNEVVRFVDGRLMRRAYEQLVNLETEYRESGMVYVCPPGHHDDLGVSCAMLVWAARHPHMPYWFRNLEASRRPRRPRKTYGWEAFT